MDVSVLQEVRTLLIDFMALVISSVVAIIGFYIRSYLQSNKFVALAEKYKLDNERIERILANSLAYAENASKKLSKDAIDSQMTKYGLAKEYIAQVAPDVLDKEKKNIDLMLSRKDEQIKSQLKVQ